MIERKPPIIVTDKAALYALSLLQDHDQESVGIKVCVKKGGCSGYEYKVEYAYKLDAMDEVVDVEVKSKGEKCE